MRQLPWREVVDCHFPQFECCFLLEQILSSQHAKSRMGKNHKHRFSAWHRCLSEQISLCCCQTRNCWIHQSNCLIKCQERNHSQRNLPRMGFDSSDREADRYHRKERQHKLRTSFTEIGVWETAIWSVQSAWKRRRDGCLFGEWQCKASKRCKLDNRWLLDSPVIYSSSRNSKNNSIKLVIIAGPISLTQQTLSFSLLFSTQLDLTRSCSFWFLL